MDEHLFSVAAVTNHYNLGGLIDRDALSHGPGGRKAEVGVSAGLAPSGGLRESLVQESLPAASGLSHPRGFLAL